MSVEFLVFSFESGEKSNNRERSQLNPLRTQHSKLNTIRKGGE
jgi:hypothetical protein